MKLAKKLTCTALAACTALSVTAVAGAAYQPEQFEEFVIPGLQAIDVTHDADAQAWFSAPIMYEYDYDTTLNDVDPDPLVIPGLEAIDCTNDADAQAWFNTPLSVYSMNGSHIFDGYVMGNRSDPDGYAECQNMDYASRIRTYVESYTGTPVTARLQVWNGSRWQDVQGMSMTLNSQNSFQGVMESNNALAAGAYRVHIYDASGAGIPVNCKVAVRPLD